MMFKADVPASAVLRGFTVPELPGRYIPTVSESVSEGHHCHKSLPQQPPHPAWNPGLDVASDVEKDLLRLQTAVSWQRTSGLSFCYPVTHMYVCLCSAFSRHMVSTYVCYLMAILLPIAIHVCSVLTLCCQPLSHSSPPLPGAGRSMSWSRQHA
jgi:hypothetical protein